MEQPPKRKFSKQLVKKSKEIITSKDEIDEELQFVKPTKKNKVALTPLQKEMKMAKGLFKKAMEEKEQKDETCYVSFKKAFDAYTKICTELVNYEREMSDKSNTDYKTKFLIYYYLCCCANHLKSQKTSVEYLAKALKQYACLSNSDKKKFMQQLRQVPIILEPYFRNDPTRLNENIFRAMIFSFLDQSMNKDFKTTFNWSIYKFQQVEKETGLAFAVNFCFDLKDKKNCTIVSN
jgi:hypothetical protein